MNKRLLKYAARIGEKPIALISLLISCLTVFFAISWHYQELRDQHLQQQNQHHHYTINVIHSGLNQHISGLQSTFSAWANNARLLNLVSNNDMVGLKRYQAQLSSLLPQVNKVCFFEPNVNQPDDKGCIPVTFAVLNSLRQARAQGQADAAILKVNGQDRLLLAYSVLAEKNDSVSLGVLAVLLDPKSVTDALLPDYGQQGYVELQQGDGQVLIVKSQGNASWRQAQPAYVKAIPNSYFKLAYWYKPEPHDILPMTLIIIIVSMFIVMWSLHQLWRGLLIKHDALVLVGQVHDLSVFKLKQKYSVNYSAFELVVDDILRLGQEFVVRKSQSNAKGFNKSKQSATSSAPARQLDVTPQLFRAYGVKGVVNTNLNDDIVSQIGLAFASEAIERGVSKLIVGFDGRQSSETLAMALIQGINEAGCDVINIGQVPAPVFYFACEQLGVPSGVMLSDSNPDIDANGLTFSLNGRTLVNDEIQALYTRITSNNVVAGSGKTETRPVVDQYISRIVERIKLNRSIRVVVDCGNGVAGSVVPNLLRALGCEVIELFCDVDGQFPNHFPNPSLDENIAELIKTVASHDAELGIAFNGDGSRLAVVDAKGNRISPDRLMIMFAQDVLSRKPGSIIMHDVKSTDLLTDAILRSGGELVVTESSPALIRNRIKDNNAELAGEMSGHIFFNEQWFGFDDAIYTTARLLLFLAADPLERSSTEVFSAVPNRVSTPEINVEMERDTAQAFIEQLRLEMKLNDAELSFIDGIRADFSNGWGIIQASPDTSSLILRFESDSEDNLDYIQQLFKQHMLQVKPTLRLLF